MKELYDAITKRRSFRTTSTLKLTENEINDIERKLKELIPLNGDIKTSFKLVPSGSTTAGRGEVCIEMFSEKKTGYLENAGYMLQQLELYLVTKNIGSCWMGIARPDEPKCEGLDYVIMLASSKVTPDMFRQSTAEFDRRDAAQLCRGELDADVIEAVRLAPSACNTQCTNIVSSNNKVEFFRRKCSVSFVGDDKLEYFNKIDSGIALCHAEVAFEYKNIKFKRTLLDGQNKTAEYILL